MPANLSPQYYQAEEEYRAASTSDERLACLERMLSVIPKHKGTDKMQADLRRRIARLKESLEKQRKKKGPSYRVRPEGAGQVMLVGPPNSGKSSLLKAMSKADPEVAAYPCTTREPMPGMVQFGGVQIQLVDLPPVWEEHCESFVFDNIRACDGAMLAIDIAATDPVADLRNTLALLHDKHVDLVPAREHPSEPDAPGKEKECLFVLNKGDLDPAGEMLDLLRELDPDLPPVRVVSAKTGQGLDALAAVMFDMLHVIRITSKEPGKEPDMEAPYTIPVGSTVMKFAEHVHKDFAEQFGKARVWGSAKFDGQIVQRDHVLRDGDIVELSKN